MVGLLWPIASLSARTLDIYWVDVEGGAATLIVTPGGQSVLIDSGNPGQRDAQRIARTATQVAGIRKIDHLITTHYHGDHFGGAATLSKLLPIGIVHDNGKFEDMPNDPPRAYWEFRCDQRDVINPGDVIGFEPADGQPGVVLRCLGARKEFVASDGDAPENGSVCATHRPKERDGSDNANSVVMLLEFGDFRFLDAGDLTWNQEQRLVCPKNLIGEVDVYQVTHHGLDSSNNPVVLHSTKPRVAIMNNGVTKGCLPEVFANLQACDSLEAVYQVHKNERPDGKVNNVPDAQIANRKAQCEGHHIQLTVARSGDSYTVSIPAHGHSRSFAMKQ